MNSKWVNKETNKIVVVQFVKGDMIHFIAEGEKKERKTPFNNFVRSFDLISKGGK